MHAVLPALGRRRTAHCRTCLNRGTAASHRRPLHCTPLPLRQLLDRCQALPGVATRTRDGARLSRPMQCMPAPRIRGRVAIPHRQTRVSDARPNHVPLRFLVLPVQLLQILVAAVRSAEPHPNKVNLDHLSRRSDGTVAEAGFGGTDDCTARELPRPARGSATHACTPQGRPAGVRAARTSKKSSTPPATSQPSLVLMLFSVITLPCDRWRS